MELTHTHDVMSEIILSECYVIELRRELLDSIYSLRSTFPWFIPHKVITILLKFSTGYFAQYSMHCAALKCDIFK